jgi:hypothetical protein
VSDGLIEHATEPTPAGFREGNSGLIVPADLSRDRETWTDEDAKILVKATAIVNASGWYLTFTCPHERCRSQPIVVNKPVPGGMELECQHKTVTVLQPMAGKPNPAIQRRLQARRDRHEERNRVALAKRVNEINAANAAKAEA